MAVEEIVGGTLIQIIAPDEGAVLPQQVVAIIETSNEKGYDLR